MDMDSGMDIGMGIGMGKWLLLNAPLHVRTWAGRGLLPSTAHPV